VPTYWYTYCLVSGNVAYSKPVKIHGENNKWSARQTVDGGMNENQVCLYLSNTNHEYSWQVDLKQLHDIEQLIIHGNRSGK